MPRSKRSTLETGQARAIRCFQSGDYSGAIEAWQSVLRLLGEDSSTHLARALCLYNIGMTYLRMGLPNNATQCLRQALHLSYQAPPPTTREQRIFHADTYHLLAQAYEKLEDVEGAMEAYHLACHAYDESGDPRRKAECLMRWANLLEQYEEFIWAANLYSKARSIAWSLREGYELAMEAEGAVERVLKALIGVE